MADQDAWIPCPRCQSTNVKRIGYTWWGGVLGPRLFNLVRCAQCGFSYNGKTGGSSTKNVIIYLVAIFVIFLILGMVLRS